jgi:hypothetical protein
MYITNVHYKNSVIYAKINILATKICWHCLFREGELVVGVRSNRCDIK